MRFQPCQLWLRIKNYMLFGKYINKYTEMAASFAEWEDEDLNAAETAYYIRVQGRVSLKLLEVAQ